MIADDEYEKEYREHLGEDDQPLPSDVGTPIQANARLRALDYWLKEQCRVREIATGEINLVEMWLARQERKIQRRIDWNEKMLRAYLEGTGRKSVELPYGTLRIRKGRERVDVVLEETFIDWAEKAGMDDTLVRVRKSPDKKAIGQYVRDTGEEPPGVLLNRGEDSFSVDTNGG